MVLYSAFCFKKLRKLAKYRLRVSETKLTQLITWFAENFQRQLVALVE